MPKGPNFRNSNAQRHDERNKPWNEKCGDVDVEKLRVKLSIDFVRARGGLTYEERLALKDRIATIQRPKEKKARLIEQKRESGLSRRAA